MQQVIDIKKTKTNQEIQDISDHNLRQKISNNIDKKRIKNNIYFVGSPGQKTIDILEEKLSKVGKYRKDAVKVVNLVLSASPDFFKDKSKAKEWEEITQKYIEETFGKENILYSVVHKDEKTPHFHIAIVPIKDGKLNASYWFDGPKKLQKFHTDYNNLVKHLGLKRGSPKVKADQKPDQQSLESYYKKVNSSQEYEDNLDKKLEKLFECIENPPIKYRLNPYSLISEVLKPAIKQLAKNLSHYRTKTKNNPDYKKKCEILEQKISDYELKFEHLGLSPDISFVNCQKIGQEIALATTPLFSQKPAPATQPNDYGLNTTNESTRKIKPR